MDRISVLTRERERKREGRGIEGVGRERVRRQ